MNAGDWGWRGGKTGEGGKGERKVVSATACARRSNEGGMLCRGCSVPARESVFGLRRGRRVFDVSQQRVPRGCRMSVRHRLLLRWKRVQTCVSFLSRGLFLC